MYKEVMISKMIAKPITNWEASRLSLIWQISQPITKTIKLKNKKKGRYCKTNNLNVISIKCLVNLIRLKRIYCWEMIVMIKTIL